MEDIERMIQSEMVNLKTKELYLSFYLNYNRKIAKWIAVGSLIISAGGILSSQVNYFWGALALLIVFVIQVAEVIGKIFLFNEAELNTYSDYKSKHVEYFNSMEQLYVEQYNNKISADEARNRFFELRKQNVEIEKLDDKLYFFKREGITRKAVNEANLYMQQYHNAQ